MRRFICIALCAMVIACGDRSEGPLVEDGKVFLRKDNGAEPQTLDPHKAQGVTASNILRDLYEGLVSESPDGSLIPGAAERWEISADGLVYSFDLRKDGRWSDGSPVTASDFVFALRRSADPETGSSYSLILAPIQNAEQIVAGDLPPDQLGVTALDDYKLEIRLRAATPYFLGLLTHSTTYPVHEASLKQHGDQFTQPGNSVTNGAYKLVEWVIGNHIKIEKNDHYRGSAGIQIDGVVYYAIDNQDAALSRYRAGELDWGDSIPITKCQWVKDNLADELQINPYLGTYYYGLNTSKPPLDDPRLRKALSLAIDRELLTEKVTKCGEIPAYGWVPPGINNYEGQRFEYESWTQEQRIAEAKKLYAEAGYSAENPATISILYNTSEGHKKIASTLSQMWQRSLGLKTELENQEWKVYLSTRKQADKTQAFRAGWIGDYNDAYTFAEIFGSKHGMNDVHFKNAAYDQLITAASNETGPAKRRALLEQAETMLLDEHVIIPLYFYVNKTLLKPWVKGYEGNIMDHHYSKNLTIEVSGQ